MEEIAFAVIAIFTLGTFWVVQGIRLQQLTLMVVPLIAGSVALLIANRQIGSGALLAVATVKPQIAVPLAAWLLLWSFGDVRSRWKFVSAFLLTLLVLVGAGEVLLPGWPQTWWAWRKVMPILARKYKVIAVDPRGLGDSDRPFTGYDTRTAAMDVHRLLERLGERRFFLVGHDVGAWIAFACAAIHPERIRRLILLDAAIPGISPQEAYQLSPRSTTWQFHFHAVPEIPEILTANKEKEYLEWFFRNKSVIKNAIQEDDVLEYVRCYSTPGAMATGFASSRNATPP